MANPDLAARLRNERDQLLARWMEVTLRRSWALRRASGKPTPQEGERLPLEILRERCESFLSSLGEALRGDPRLDVGSPALREPVQMLSFTAGWMAGRGLPIGDAVALVQGLEDTLEQRLEALMVVVTESYSAALTQKEQARFRDAMEKSQLVCTLHSRLPCLFLVGDPDLQALDDAMGRLLMLAVMREAQAVIVDASGLFRQEPLVRAVLALLLDDERQLVRHPIVTGLTPELLEALRPLAGERVSLHEALPAAIAEAAELSDLRWPASP